MKLTFRKREVKDLSQLQALVAENAEAVEPGFRVIGTAVNFGRSTVEVIGVDRRGTPALVAVGLTADDAMLFSMVEAYAWTLEYPESVRRLVSDGGSAGGWPPRVVFVAERLPESFLRKIRLLAFHAVNCFEYRSVEVNDTVGFYLEPVDWARSAHSPGAPPVIPAAEPRLTDGVGGQAATKDDAGGPASWPAAGNTSPARWFGLRTPRSETPTLEPSPGRAQFPAPVAPPTVPGPSEPPRRPPELELREFAVDPIAAAPGAPIAAAPTVEEPLKEVAQRPAAPTDAAKVADDPAVVPTWRKFLEKLAGTLDLHPAEGAPTAPTAERTERTLEPEHESAFSQAGRLRNGGANRHDDLRQRALLDAVKLPNAELAPQWRKFLEKPPLDQAKIAAVHEYLHREFPMCTIYGFYEHQRNAQVLQLQDGQGQISYVAVIRPDFLEAHGEFEVQTALEKMQLSLAMRHAGQAGVLVTPSGPEIQKR